MPILLVELVRDGLSSDVTYNHYIKIYKSNSSLNFIQMAYTAPSISVGSENALYLNVVFYDQQVYLTNVDMF